MTEKQAIAEGLIYTGMSFNKYDQKNAQKYKERVAELKKRYKVRAVLVYGSNGYNSYYGDKNFEAVHWNSEETLQQRIDNMNNRYENAKKEYEETLRKLQEEETAIKKKLEFINSIKK